MNVLSDWVVRLTLFPLLLKHWRNSFFLVKFTLMKTGPCFLDNSWSDVSLAWTILWPTCFCSSPWTTSTSLTFLCRASTAVVITSVGTQVMVLFKLFIPPPGFVLIHMNGIQSSFYRFFNPVKSGLGGKWWLLGKPTRSWGKFNLVTDNSIRTFISVNHKWC